MYKILVVDKEKFNLDLIEAALMDRKYILLNANDNFEALQIFKENHDISLVLGCNNVEGGGISLFKEIQNITNNKFFPFINFGSAYQEFEALKEGIELFVTKPYDIEILDLKIHNILSREYKKQA